MRWLLMTDVNLIERIKTVTMQECDAPEIFHTAMAYHTISSTLGLFFKARTLKFKRPNVWFVLSCIPGGGRRTSIQDLHDTIVDSSFYNFYRQHNTELTKEEAGELVMLSKIESGTEAGICDAIMDGIDKGVISFMICNSEFGHVLKRMSNEKDPTAGLDALLCKLYYGERYKQTLSKFGKGKGVSNVRFIPKGLYVTMFSGMQEPNQYLRKSLSESGLMRRIKFAYVKHTDFNMEDWKSPFRDSIDVTIVDVNRQLKEIALREIVPRMKKYFKLVDTLHENVNFKDEGMYLNIHFTKEAIDKVTEISKFWDTKIIEEKTDYNIYMLSHAEHISTIAILNAIAKDKWKGGGKDEHITGCMFVELSDVEEAIKVTLEMDKHAFEMLENIRMTEKMVDVSDLESRVETKIQSSGSDGILHSDLRHAFPGVLADEMNEILLNLKEKIKIDTITVTTQGKGRPGMRHIHTMYNDIT